MSTTPVGVPEIAQRLKKTKGEVQRWLALGELPKAPWEVNGAPAWPWHAIQEWAAETNRPLPIVPRRAKEHA